jgi:hypothetical protein
MSAMPRTPTLKKRRARPLGPQVAGEPLVDIALHGGGGIDQDGAWPRGQEQRRAQHVAIGGRKCDVVDEDGVPRVSATAISPVISRPLGNDEFSFCGKGLSNKLCESFEWACDRRHWRLATSLCITRPFATLW